MFTIYKYAISELENTNNDYYTINLKHKNEIV